MNVEQTPLLGRRTDARLFQERQGLLGRSLRRAVVVLILVSRGGSFAESAEQTQPPEKPGLRCIGSAYFPVPDGAVTVPLPGGDFETDGKVPAGWALGGGQIVTADDAPAREKLLSVPGPQGHDPDHATRSGPARRPALLLLAVAEMPGGSLDLHRLPLRRAAAHDRRPLSGHPGHGQPMETGRVLRMDAGSSQRTAPADSAAQGQPGRPVHRRGRRATEDGYRGRNVGSL